MTTNGNGVSVLDREPADEQLRTPTQLVVPRMNIQRIEITLIGDSQLITHKWSDKAKKMMRDKQQKRGSQAKEAKDPHQEFLDATYVLGKREDGTTIYGFPAVGFKASMVGACRFANMKMTEARGAFHVVGEYVEIVCGGEPIEREDMVRIGMGVADIRYRPGFEPWGARLLIDYNAGAISPEQIANLLDIAGFGIGVGEWRPENDGSFGRFHVATDADELPKLVTATAA